MRDEPDITVRLLTKDDSQAVCGIDRAVDQAYWGENW